MNRMSWKNTMLIQETMTQKPTMKMCVGNLCSAIQCVNLISMLDTDCCLSTRSEVIFKKSSNHYDQLDLGVCYQ